MTPAPAEAIRPTRVLVFTVDDACLCVDLDRVDTVYPRHEARRHSLKAGGGMARSFLIHRGEPALVVDLREALGLNEILGITERAAFVVVRGGSFPLAVAVDACIGVRDLDLHTRAPLPTALQRDGGFSVGHLVELDGRTHTLLEPTRILSSTLREHFDPYMREAHAFCEREQQIAALAEKLRTETTLTDLKAYARLVRRNGRTRAATVARAVLKAAQECAPQTTDTVAGDLAADTLLRDLLSLSAARQTGELHVTPTGGDAAVVFYAIGRIADAQAVGTWGRTALKHVLAAHEGSYRFVPSDVPIYPQRIEDATPWTLVDTLAHLTDGRRGRLPR